MFHKKLTAIILSLALVLCAASSLAVVKSYSGGVSTAEAATTDTEVRGVWLSIYDYSSLNMGLYTDSEAAFRANAKKFLSTLSSYHLNTVYMQVRAFDDAAWMSSTYPAMTYISPAAKALGEANLSQPASETLAFDPLKIMVEEAHALDISLIAWMNPYRISTAYYLNPGASSSQTRVVKAVKEVMKYDVDGIIFDDYFYHAASGYRNIVKDQVTLTAAGAAKLSSAKKAAYVNKLIARVYSRVKSADADATFGISPQGNLENDRASGADVDTWLSKEGYIDYLMPQIYWTDDYGTKGGTTMFTDRVELFTDPSLDKLGKTKYIALALYRCGNDYSTDHGWTTSSTNLAEQYEVLTDAGCTGYSLFSAAYLMSKKSASELSALNEAITAS